MAVKDKVSLPHFEALDSDGNRVLSDQGSNKVVVVAFFDLDSVLAWRTLSKLGEKYQSQNKTSAFLIGIASSRNESAEMLSLNSLKNQYQIFFPIIPDREKRLSQALQSPNCCDYLNIYDTHGTLTKSMRLSEAYDQLDSIVAESLGTDPATERPSALKGPEILNRIKITSHAGVQESIPMAGQGLTVVNLFDQFCTECPTGIRFQTMNRLNQLRQPISRMFIVLSEKNFSTEDVENFKTILSAPDLLVQGDMEGVKPYLIKGKLLMVFDSHKNLIWQENPGMTEQEVLTDVSRLLQSSTN
jgi:peroxiredoxin